MDAQVINFKAYSSGAMVGFFDLVVGGIVVTGCKAFCIATPNPAQEMLQKFFAEAPPLPGRVHIGVADEGHFPQVLAAHNSRQDTALFITPKIYSGFQFIFQIPQAHIGLVPAIRRDDSPISLSRGIDDAQNGVSLV